jgi:hypothetical protein
MTKTKKPTKKEMFAQILARTVDEAEKEFLAHEIELLDNKGKKKDGELTETQKANKVLGEAILEPLSEGSSMTISAMIKNVPACEGLSTSKVSAVVRGLKTDGLVVREEIKGVAFFKKA